MIPGLFNDQQSLVLRDALNGLSTRQQVIANNIANVDTPDFTARQVNFESTLQAAVNGQLQSASGVKLFETNVRHLPGLTDPAFSATPMVSLNEANAPRMDGNNVNMDQEMSNLAATSIEFQAMTELTNISLSQRKLAITVAGQI